MQAFATVDIGLVMPSVGDVAHAAAGRRSGANNAFKFFEPLRLQLRGSKDAMSQALARAARKDSSTAHVDAARADAVTARIRAVVLATTAILVEARKKVVSSRRAFERRCHVSCKGSHCPTAGHWLQLRPDAERH